jgi:hypothetical protein
MSIPPKRERVIRGEVSTEHLVHLFDDSSSLAQTLAGYLFEGWERGQTLLVVARLEHWNMTAAHLSDLGFPVDDEIESERLIVRDAVATLAMITRGGSPDRLLFEEHIAKPVRHLHARSGQPVRIFGEMVDILAGQGDFVAAQRLEELWNALGATASLTLLCGYSSASFGDPRTAPSLRDICGLHTEAAAKPADLLASWLLANRNAQSNSLQ